MTEFCCKICSTTYVSKQSYARHIATTKHKIRENTDKKVYACKCGLKYTNRPNLYRHKAKCNYQEPLIETTPQETITTPQPIIQNKYEAAIQKLQQENKTLKKENKILKMQLKNRTKVSPSMRQIVADNQERKCGHCQNHLNTFFQIDHIIGKQFGGDNDFDNLMALCGECHNQKSALENIKRKRIKDAIQAILQETPP